MIGHLREPLSCVFFAISSILLTLEGSLEVARASNALCEVESRVYEGWKAEQISNQWVQLIIVPQLGGRLMQVTFDGHPYLFVNPELKGKYFPPLTRGEKSRWYNYGGDKLWPLPEGDQDEHHWPGPLADVLDDGEYTFQILSRSPRCSVQLESPPDPRTGLQYSREISVGNDSPEIRFRSEMKNVSTHPIEWSMQTVTQYDTAAATGDGYNPGFWAFTSANPKSAYLNGYHVRSGLADDPSYSLAGGLFTLHWLPLENEVWLDAPAGWIAVVDGSTRYAMVEKYSFHAESEYPGKASVIFYKNGASLELDEQGSPKLRASPENALRYMEAELNSPLVKLVPGQSYAMETQWFPARAGKELDSVSESGVMSKGFSATRSDGKVTLQGTLGVFVPGKLEARFLDARKATVGVRQFREVMPEEDIELSEKFEVPASVTEVSIHLIDALKKDRGALVTAEIKSATGSW